MSQQVRHLHLLSLARAIGALSLCFTVSATAAQDLPQQKLAMKPQAAVQPKAHSKPAPKAARQGRLKEAYQNEVAYLLEEKASLTKLKDELSGRLSKDRAAHQKQLTALQAELESLRSESASLERGLMVLEDSSAQMSAAVSQLENLVAGDKDSPMASRVKTAFEKNLASLKRQSSLSTAKGKFFDDTGVEVEAVVTSIGEVAAFGERNGKAYILAPSGGGRLKSVAEVPLNRIEALRHGDMSAAAGAFLFWPDRDVDFTPRAEKTLVSTIKAAGPIGLVIVALFFLAISLIVVRALMLLRSSSALDAIRLKIVDAVVEGDVSAARKMAESNGLFRRALLPILDAKDAKWSAREDIAGEGVLAVTERLEKFSTVILVIAAVAPLLGLLGTVTGMIATFDSITAFGTGDPRVLSGGISEALITTELGLVVAITSLFLGQVLAALGERTLNRLETCALSVAHALEGDGPQPARHPGRESMTLRKLTIAPAANEVVSGGAPR